MINIKNIAIFTIGAAVGAGAGCLFFKKKYETFADEEITSVRDMYMNRVAKSETQPLDYEKTEKEDWEISPEEVDSLTREELKTKMNNKYGKASMEEQVKRGMTKEEYDALDDEHAATTEKKDVMSKSVEQINKENQERALSRRTKKKDIIDYTKIASKYKEEASADKEVVTKKGSASIHDDMEEMHRVSAEYDKENGVPLSDEEERENEIMNQSPGDNVPEPEVITAQSFIDECPDNQKITINYYAEDDILVDEDENPIDNVEIVVGYDSLNQFGKMGTEEDVVYVRNAKFEIDYEIIKLHESYHIAGK